MNEIDLIRNISLHPVDSVRESLRLVSEKWNIAPEIYDLHMGKRDDVKEEILKIDKVHFHIPFLLKDNMYVLWRCLWPDCHNCCKRQTGLPLTMDDIKIVSKRIGCGVKDFIANETLISTWSNAEIFGQVNTIRTQLCLKRKVDETECESTAMIPCRFLDAETGCSIHPDKPSVCWMYPFASYFEMDSSSRLSVHAKFQFTGDCPGFYLDESIDSMMTILNEYSTRIYNHNLASSRARRLGYSAASSVRLDID